MIISEKQIWAMMEAIRAVLNDDRSTFWNDEAKRLLANIMKQQSEELKVIE